MPLMILLSSNSALNGLNRDNACSVGHVVLRLEIFQESKVSFLLFMASSIWIYSVFIECRSSGDNMEKLDHVKITATCNLTGALMFP